MEEQGIGWVVRVWILGLSHVLSKAQVVDAVVGNRTGSTTP